LSHSPSARISDTRRIRKWYDVARVIRFSMSALVYRVAGASDVPAMAAVRAAAWGTQNYWETRISGYMARELNPQHALQPRVL
jgi:hypothetical protein